MITLFQHGKDESPGEIGIYLGELRIPFRIIRLFENDTIPAKLPSDLIVLGGQMSVNNTEQFPFLLEEKRVIREMINEGRPVLAICLGAQMIASAFGQKVFPDAREQGWVTIHPCSNTTKPFFSEPITVFHWHNETFTLPAEAILLAQGSIIENQAFRLGSAIGVQYHPEVTGEIISRWATGLRPEEKMELLREYEKYSTIHRQNCRLLIDRFLRGWDVERD